MKIHILHVELQNGQTANAAFTTTQGALFWRQAVIEQCWEQIGISEDKIPLIVDGAVDGTYWFAEVELDAPLKFDDDMEIEQ